NIASFDTTRRFGPWLYRIVVTRGLNFRKSRSRRAAEPLEDAAVASRDVGPAAAAEQAGLRDTVMTALSQLPERQRMVVQLFELDGFSGVEIAEMLGVSPGTVRWYLHEARQALRRRPAGAGCRRRLGTAPRRHRTGGRARLGGGRDPAGMVGRSGAVAPVGRGGEHRGSARRRGDALADRPARRRPGADRRGPRV